MPSENLTNARAARGKSTPPTGGDEIDAMMLGGNDGKGGNGKGPAIYRCCVGKDNPYIHLYCTGVHIFLALPMVIQTSTQPIWQPISTGEGMGKAILSTLATGGGNFLNSMGEAIGFAANAIKNPIKSGAALLAGDSSFLKAQHDIATLPAKELQFQGIDHRSITFQWKLVPLNAKDTQEIDKMIQQVQARILPGFAAGVMGYPELWVIEFGDGSKNFMPVIKDSVCNQFDVNYSGDGKTYVHNKQYAPVTYQITMKFTEATLFTREDVLMGIYG